MGRVHGTNRHRTIADDPLTRAGWGFYAAITQTVTQAAVSTSDLATVTAFFLLVAKIGSAIGNTITTAIWRDLMPKKLAGELLGITDQTTIDTIFGDITYVATLDATDPIRMGAMQA
jgi:SIT family siderophore-iron:H+ symporter-like MFS transporter